MLALKLGQLLLSPCLGEGGGEGSQQVTFQGIRQTVGIKGFTWQRASYPRALRLSPSPVLFLSHYLLAIT